MKATILHEQIEYYRARADEYDQSIASGTEIFDLGKSILVKLGSFDRILELACGTGVWTETLLKMGKHVTALDAAPEMLDVAKKKLGETNINYQQVDLFQWKPDGEYDLVFFANWLSHVPPDALDEFLTRAVAAVRFGGSIAIVDQHAPSDADKAIAKDVIYAKRPLQDGRQFTIIKAFYDLHELTLKLSGLGFDVAVDKFAEPFFLLTGKKK
jgi:demethylmenaquinone methyltransferase/2-methoxy-6-polyprenyl-1,4-benzoquinol methylase